MILPEAEAKTKWCPYAGERKDTSERCLASDCMAWRWEKRQSPEELKQQTAWNKNAASEEPKGYCGA